MKIDIGLFAHNEADGIIPMLKGLMSQDIFADPEMDVRVLVLANGCRDDTVSLAMAAAGPLVEVVDLTLGGKARTWNRFVHDLSRDDADHLVFCDADIELPQPETLRRMVGRLAAHPDLWVFNSRPVKDIAHRPEGLSWMERIIAAAGGGLDDWKSAICGQLYAMPTACARKFHLPIGLPVEDGFLRAMVLTDGLTAPERPEAMARIDGLDGVYHLYRSERRIGALIAHQTRIVIGSAVNFAVFGHLRDAPAGQRRAMLVDASTDADWLAKVLKARLPRVPFGYVPFHFLFKRLVRAFEQPRGLWHPKRLLILLLGFGFDALVYLKAQWKMLRGAGAGFW